VGGGGNIVGIDLAEAKEVVEDLRELLAEAGDVFLAEAEAGEPGDVLDLLAG
jgi:ribosomal protein L7/L12